MTFRITYKYLVFNGNQSKVINIKEPIEFSTQEKAKDYAEKQKFNYIGEFIEYNIIRTLN